MKSLKFFLTKRLLLLFFLFLLIGTEVTIAERFIIVVQIDIHQIDSSHSYHIIIIVMNGLRVVQFIYLFSSDGVHVLQVVNVDIY